MPTAAPTPKAVLHQRFGVKARYTVEEVREAVDGGAGGCPGLAPQTRSVYRCTLELPDLSVATPGTFLRKKDAEQAAAQIALDKLGIQPIANTPRTPEEAWDELIARISGFFADDNFLSSTHPLIGHLSVILRRTRDLIGRIPMSAIAACDVKVNTLCKIIDPRAESEPLLVLSLIYNAAKQSPGVSVSDSNFWIQSQKPYSAEAVDSAFERWSDMSGPIEIEAILVPQVLEDEPKTVRINLENNEHYMGSIASKLSATGSSHVVVSRTLGKASSEIRLYFAVPSVQFVSDFSKNALACHGDGNISCLVNKRASYISGQTIYGDAILANIGYTRRDSEIHTEDVNLCTYYRILLGKLPDGNYKMSKDSILAAELPYVYSRASWKGLSPRDLLCSFCRLQRLSEPYFAISKASNSSVVFGSTASYEERLVPTKNADNHDTNDGRVDKENPDMFKCDVKICSRKQEILLEYSADNTFSKESDAVQNSALKVLIWFNKYFKQLNTKADKLSLSECTGDFKIHPNTFLQEFAMCLSVYAKTRSNDSRIYSAVGPFSATPNQQLENSVTLTHVEGPDSGIFPSHGSLTCISYIASLMMKDTAKTYSLEENNEFEFEIGAGAVISQLESCVTQLSVNQTACFIAELPPTDSILAAASEFSNELSNISRESCFLEFSVKVLQVTEPLEDRMEKALFSPPLSKQRVEFAIRHINELHATTLVDFGCGSGSLLDSLLEHPTTLENVVGVDISRKGLTRAAKCLHQKLSKKSLVQTRVPSAVLYDGSIMEFDSRLYGFDIGTCLEVIEHMEEDQASLCGNVILSAFCPKVFIVSTPNYEYNPILQRSAMPNKEDEPEENTGPCKFRNHDHKFEWTRVQFQSWAIDLAVKHNYSVEFDGVGGSGEEPGYASQIAVFRKLTQDQEAAYLRKDQDQPYELLWEWPNASVAQD
ncbi:hypothetical protein QOZ80_7BG0587580 [Eleusine coracana subsp. coracana]|nr:hypothetical protein QOZ80_7BG0587580 [Eleusine coracana subsp. coracana]